jgi:hypothetical protein
VDVGVLCGAGCAVSVAAGELEASGLELGFGVDSAPGVAGAAGVEDSKSELFNSLLTPNFSCVFNQARDILMMRKSAIQTHVDLTIRETPPEAPKKPAELPPPKAEPIPPSLPCCRPIIRMMSIKPVTTSKKVSKPMSMGSIPQND